MAKSRVRVNRRRHSRKIKEPKWSAHKKAGMTTMAVILGILAILAIIGALIRYYRLVTK